MTQYHNLRLKFWNLQPESQNFKFFKRHSTKKDTISQKQFKNLGGTTVWPYNFEPCVLGSGLQMGFFNPNVRYRKEKKPVMIP